MADKATKRYPIETLQDFLQVPPDRLDDCLADFRDYLELIRPLSALIDMANPPSTRPRSPTRRTGRAP